MILNKLLLKKQKQVFLMVSATETATTNNFQLCVHVMSNLAHKSIKQYLLKYTIKGFNNKCN